MNYGGLTYTSITVISLLALLLIFPGILPAQPPIRFVDPLIGTAPATTESAKRHSEAGSELKGQTFPGVGQPFGMTQWTPETRITELKCIAPYYYDDPHITGFRGSHWMSGSCTQDYGSMTVMPFSTNQPDTIHNLPVSGFSHQDETASPAYYRLWLQRYGILAELTGTVRSGFLRFSCSGEIKSFMMIRANSDRKLGRVWFDSEHNEIVGYNPVYRIYQGQGQPAGFSGYFVIRADRPFEVLSPSSSPQQLIIGFGNQQTVQVKIGTSFTGIEAARHNLEQEIPGWDFDRVRKGSEAVWNRSLSRIRVKNSSAEDKTKFYTALYHCFQLPRTASDADGSYQGFAQDTAVHHAEGFTYYDDFSMWDTYRALHPLLTLLEPRKTLDMVKSLLLKAEQGGWMPIFPAWGNYTAAMIGDHVSTMICDAYVKGITAFDAEKAYFYMRKNAFESPSDAEYLDGKGRRALKSYLEYGYIPLEDDVLQAFHKREQVSRTLEYAFDDFALAQFANRLGKTADYAELMRRSQNYRNVFDTLNGYVRGRYADGRWFKPFDPFRKASFICEGTPFQYTWYVPHDIPGLIQLMGGKKAFLDRLSTFFDKNHYWHGNEPDHQVAYLFAMAGDPASTRKWVRKIVEEEYGTGPGGLSGNEDAGQMSAWLVFSMIGFYPVCPGTGEYVKGSPMFRKIILLPDKGKKLVILAPKAKAKMENTGSVRRHGKLNPSVFLRHEDLLRGGKIVSDPD